MMRFGDVTRPAATTRGMRFEVPEEAAATISRALMQRQGTSPRDPAVERVASAVMPKISGGQFGQLFQQKEAEYGLPSGYLARTAQIESAMNPAAKNPRSSATGLFQFIDGTARDYGLSDRLDPVASTDAAARLARDNADVLRRALGREPTAAELYLAHQQGAGGAVKLLQNQDAMAASVVGGAAAGLNGGRAGMTAGEFASKWTSKFDQGGRSGVVSTSGGGGLDGFQPQATRFVVDPGAPVTRERLAELDIEVARQYGRGATVQIGRDGAVQVQPPGGGGMSQTGQGGQQADPLQAWADQNFIPLSPDMIPSRSTAEIEQWVNEQRRRGVRLSERDQAKIQQAYQLAQMYEQPNGEILLRRHFTEQLGWTPPQQAQTDWQIEELADGRKYYVDPAGTQPPRLVNEGLEVQPDPGYRMMTPDEVAQVPGLDPQRAYQIGPNDKITAVGGSNQTINVNNPGSEVGTIPPGYELITDRETGARSLRPIPGGPVDQEQRADEKAQERAARTSTDNELTRSGVVTEATGAIRTMLDDTRGIDLPEVGIWGERLNRWGLNQEAADMGGMIDTLKGMVVFDRLEKLRQASATGSSGLGQVTEREIALLGAQLGALDQRLSPDRIRVTLNTIDDVFGKLSPQAEAYLLGGGDDSFLSMAAPEAAQEVQEMPEAFLRNVPEGADPQKLWEAMPPANRRLFE